MHRLSTCFRRVATLEKHLMAHFQRSTRCLLLITPSNFPPIERTNAADEERHFPTEWREFDFKSPLPRHFCSFPFHGGVDATSDA
ncbi:hypothetical protein CEXT_155961 [Caerostris extrusa]|uniref:Uncharacterized protein n=1 Tax=Caerostris extrusa TaxID=172846 RepID=A0AAV4QCQ5_CAEEX|nr:hypothetical protein CEXT_155961 [Caerostris extrusa]